MRSIAVFVTLTMFFLASATVEAGGLARETAASLRRSAAALADLEKADDAGLAEAEIERAREWLEEGSKLLRAGKIRPAATLAQRLPSQLILIRAVIAAQKVARKAEALEEKVLELEARLKKARAIYDRLVIRRDGADATLAYPRKGGGPDAK